MKAKIITISMSVLLIIGCSNSPKMQQKADNTLIDSTTARFLMPEELPAKALDEIRNAITASDTLTDEFLFQVIDDWMALKETKLGSVIEGMMQKSESYHGIYTYSYEWVSQDSVDQCFLEYLRKKDASTEKMDSVKFREVLNDIEEYVGNNPPMTQTDMNAWAHVEMVGERNYMIGMYKELLRKTKDPDLHKAYFSDFVAWREMSFAVNERHAGGYSMYPLEIASYKSEMMRLRSNLLREEAALLLSGKPCLWDSKQHPINWEKGDADLLRPWYDLRMARSKDFKDKQYAEAFRTMTEKIAYIYLQKNQFDIVCGY